MVKRKGLAEVGDSAWRGRRSRRTPPDYHVALPTISLSKLARFDLREIDFARDFACRGWLPIATRAMYVCPDIYEHEGGGEGEGTIILYIIFFNDSFIF